MSTVTPGWRERLRHPQTTVRLRLTLLYGGLFLACGAGLLAITYALVDHASVQPALSFIGPAPGSRASTQVRPKVKNFVPANAPPPVQQALSSLAGRRAVRVVVSDQRIADQHQLVIESAVALAIMAIISTALGWLVAGRVLRPLRVMTVSTREISADNLHRRLRMAGPHDELRELADTIDGLLGRLEGSFLAQRRFVMNASHELRTPLTAVRALLEMVMADPDATVETYREISRQVLEENREQEQLIDALLALAQGQRGVTRTEALDLAGIVEHALELRRADVTAGRLEVQAELAPATIRGDRRLVQRLVANLVENAIVHNRPGGSITLRTQGGERTAELVVANTGADVPESEIDRLLQPFQRMAAERVGTRRGLGLGLSIVAAIAEAHEAELDARAQSGGGLAVTVRFPAGRPEGISLPATGVTPKFVPLG